MSWKLKGQVFFSHLCQHQPAFISNVRPLGQGHWYNQQCFHNDLIHPTRKWEWKSFLWNKIMISESPKSNDKDSRTQGNLLCVMLCWSVNPRPMTLSPGKFFAQSCIFKKARVCWSLGHWCSRSNEMNVKTSLICSESEMYFGFTAVWGF